MIIRNDKNSFAAVQDAVRAAQKRIATLDNADDREQQIQAVNDLLDAVDRDIDALAFIDIVEGRPIMSVDGEKYSLHISAPCRSALILDQLGETRRIATEQ